MYIYLITNLINDKVYIGQSSKNWDDTLEYYGSGSLIKKAIESHGIENFKKTLLETCYNKEELDNAERYWISHYRNKLNYILYNITDGGSGGVTYTKGSLVYEQCKHKLGHTGTNNPGSKPEVIEKRVRTYSDNIKNGLVPTSGKLHGNYKGKLERIHNKYKGGAPSSNARKVVIDGIEYNSLREASRALDIAAETIARRCKLDKFKKYNFI